ncbi:MAG TPA: hypothetical protein VK190_02615 [Pseudoneobacillus sp.]|nr:hypothetical protein [Pseudoneobacillus sp.]
MDNIQKLNELRDGIFQVAMLLYTEYVKYMSEADARTCVFNDLVEKAQTFVEKPINNLSPEAIVVKTLEEKHKELFATYNKTKDATKRYELMQQIEKLDDVIKLIKG